MNVKIMKPYGFCAGVEYVINFLHKIIEKHQGEKIYCLGQIVHNNRVNKEISDLGVEIIEGDKWESIEKIDHGVIVFSAHGTPKELIEKAVEKKLIVYDAVCPFVKKELEHVIKYIQNGYDVIFVGVRNHDEANAVISISKKINMISEASEVKHLKINNDKIVIINQTTLSIAQLGQIHKEIIKKYPTAIIDDDICNSSRIRQKNIEKESLNYDLVVVIGDNHSNNTKTLFNEAKKKNSNVEMCSKVCDLKNEWFVNKNSVLVASGASVSKKNVEEIVEEIKKYKKY